MVEGQHAKKFDCKELRQGKTDVSVISNIQWTFTLNVNRAEKGGVVDGLVDRVSCHQ
jgi:hypothetical protein